MIIVTLWALFLTRLICSLIGYMSPEFLASGPLVVFFPIPCLLLGIWVGTRIYNAWPEGHKTLRTPLSSGNIITSTAITLPLFYLLWPLLVRVPPTATIGSLVLTLLPCALKFRTRQKNEESPNEMQGALS